jgi:hypothetical protein
MAPEESNTTVHVDFSGPLSPIPMGEKVRVRGRASVETLLFVINGILSRVPAIPLTLTLSPADGGEGTDTLQLAEVA